MSGTRHDVLDEREMERFEWPERFRNELDRLAADHGRARASLRVLEWGCGRGRMLAALVDCGFDVCGIDVDAASLDNGRKLFAERGLSPERRLRLWSPGSPLPFPDGHFDAVISDQVIEHVADLDEMARESRRVLTPDGIALHFYPARWRVIEPHLEMPCVHWLPAGPLRAGAIRAWIALGREPRWRELVDAAADERARFYHDYTQRATHWRGVRSVARHFRRHGFECRFEGTGGSSRALRVASRAARRWPWLRPWIDAWQRSFHATWLLARRGGAPPCA